MHGFWWAVMLCSVAVAGCSDASDAQVVDVELLIENQSQETIAMRLYAVVLGGGPDGQDAWLPPRIEGVKDAGGEARGTGQLVVYLGDFETLRFWATATDAIESQETYVQVPDTCTSATRWTASAWFDGGIHAAVDC